MAVASPVVTAAETTDNAKIRRVIAASVFGTIIEWYDFLIYSTAAALVFRSLFFPQADPFVGALAAFGAYAVGFFARPLGGIVFGHFGDRTGRKAMLILTLIITGGGTFLAGLLPTYAQIGALAPVLMLTLRLVQGLGVGGEWGGAVLMVAETVPSNRRGLYGSLVQLGNPLGRILATGAFALVVTLPEPQLIAWGWRLPFLASAVLVILGLFMRSRLEETPEFVRMRAAKKQSKLPAADVFRRHPRALLISIGLKVSEVGWANLLSGFCVYYVTKMLNMPSSVIVDAILIAAAVEVGVMPLVGWISDRVGRRPIFIVGVVLSALFAFPVFWMLDTRDVTMVTLAIVIGMTITQGIMFALHASLMPELFGTSVRYSGVSLGFQVGAAITGGLTPLIATSLVGWSNGATWPVSLYMLALSLLTLWAILAVRPLKQVSGAAGPSPGIPNPSSSGSGRLGEAAT